MTSRNRKPERRQPRQQRSREMVDRIIDAGHTVMLEHGYDRASTGRIAAEARISPGSLYQYFPDKHAVLARVIERSADRLRTRISSAFVSALDTPSLRDGVRANVLALLDSFEANDGLLRVLYEQLPRNADTHRADFERRIDELVTTALLFQNRGRGGEPLDAIAWILVRTVENLTISYVLDRPPIGRDTVVEEITTLITDYLDDRIGPAQHRQERPGEPT